MRKIRIVLPLVLVAVLSACSNDTNSSTSNQDLSFTEGTVIDSNNEKVVSEETNNQKDKDIALEPTNNDILTEAETEEASANKKITDSTGTDTDEDKSENQNEDSSNKSDISANTNVIQYTPVDKIPNELLTIRKDYAGTIEHISYQTKDYFGDNAEITKYAYVYLPYNYDRTKQYNVLYLMHGIGGNEKEWGMYNDISKVKAMMDNLIYNGSIDPFIIVAPNGRSSKNFADTSSDYNSFYLFGQELRNDLIPYIDNNFSTYGESDEKGYDLTASRDHRAMAGLSMGGMQTINIGMCESLDIISYFGAFSAAPTTYTASKIATALKDYPDYNIHYFYNICGLQDGIAINSASSAVNSLTSLTDKLAEGVNYTWQEVNGGHDFNVWYLGFYNFAQIAFQ